MQPDNNLLTGLNLDQFSEADRQKILEKVYNELEDRVGTKVQSAVGDEQFTQFEAIVDEADETKMDGWLDKNVPEYEQIIQETLDAIKQEVTANPQAFLGKRLFARSDLRNGGSLV